MDEELNSKRAELRRANQRYRKTNQRIRRSVKMLKDIGRLQRKLRREISELENERVSDDDVSSSELEGGVANVLLLQYEISLAPPSKCVRDCCHDNLTPFITFCFGNKRSMSGSCIERAKQLGAIFGAGSELDYNLKRIAAHRKNVRTTKTSRYQVVSVLIIFIFLKQINSTTISLQWRLMTVADW